MINIEKVLKNILITFFQSGKIKYMHDIKTEKYYVNKLFSTNNSII